MEKTILKGKYVCFEEESYGIFLIAIEEETGAEEQIITAAGESSFISTYSVESSWQDLLEIIKELVEDEEASIEMGRDIAALLKAHLPEIREKLNSSIGELDFFLKELFENYLKSQVSVSLSKEKSENFEAVDLAAEKAIQKEKERLEEEREHYKIPSNCQVVECFAVLSPIKGTPIKEIQERDLVLCRIDDSSELGKNIASIHGLYTQDQRLKPSIGKVEGKFYEGNEVVLTLRLKRDLIGMAREDDAVKVTYVEPKKIISKQEVLEQKQRKVLNKQNFEEQKKEQAKNEMYFYLAVGLAVVLLALLMLIFF